MGHLPKPTAQRQFHDNMLPRYHGPMFHDIMVPWSDEMGDGFPSVRKAHHWWCRLRQEAALPKPTTQRSANFMITCYPVTMKSCSTNIMIPWPDEMGDGFPSILAGDQ